MLVVQTQIGVSKLHGIGLFAAEKIEKGEVVWRNTALSEKVFSSAELETIKELSPPFYEQLQKYCYRYQGNFHLCLDDSRHMNHSADSNTRMIENGNCVATRTIAVGEEITSDYREYNDGLHFELMSLS